MNASMPLLAPVTLEALRAFPAQLEAHFAAFPEALRHWAPPSWEGVPSEAFTAIEQVCHVRDIELEGYHLRIRRTLEEDTPCWPRWTANGWRGNATTAPAIPRPPWRHSAPRAKPPCGCWPAWRPPSWNAGRSSRATARSPCAGWCTTCAATTSSTWPACNGCWVRPARRARRKAAAVQLPFTQGLLEWANAQVLARCPPGRPAGRFDLARHRAAAAGRGGGRDRLLASPAVRVGCPRPPRPRTAPRLRSARH